VGQLFPLSSICMCICTCTNVCVYNMYVCATRTQVSERALCSAVPFGLCTWGSMGCTHMDMRHRELDCRNGLHPRRRVSPLRRALASVPQSWVAVESLRSTRGRTQPAASLLSLERLGLARGRGATLSKSANRSRTWRGSRSTADLPFGMSAHGTDCWAAATVWRMRRWRGTSAADGSRSPLD